MQRNGFEATRALWAYPAAGGYEVFAGGTRLAAARQAGLAEVPVLVHADFTAEEISRLADEDNENDEYHVPIPLPDMWIEYRRLNEDEGWTQQQIAAAKGVAQQTVAMRCKYAAFPMAILRDFTKNDFLKEGHALELSKLQNFCNLAPWLTRDHALTEILAEVLDKHRNGSHGVSPTATVFTKAVEGWNAMITAAQATLAALPAHVEDGDVLFAPHERLLTHLAATHVRTTKDVTLAAGQLTRELHAIAARTQRRLAEDAQRLSAAQTAAAQAAERLALQRVREERFQQLLGTLQHGDCRTLIPSQCPSGIRLVLTDPPYGTQFVSHRRRAAARKDAIPGDTSLDAAALLLGEMLTVVQPKLLPDAHLFVFTHQASYARFCTVFQTAGFTLRRTMTWCKGTHGLGDVTRGEVLTETEWLIHAVQGNPKFSDDIARPELLAFPGQQDTYHPAEKPLALLRHLVELGSTPGEIVVDPFAGTANSLLAILSAGRQGWACEQEEPFYRDGAAKLYQWLQTEAGP
jgi:hypothetical protein